MIIDLGNHTIECDFDPRIQCNNSAEKLPIEDIGFIYNCVFKQRSATIRSIEGYKRSISRCKDIFGIGWWFRLFFLRR